MPNTVVEAVVGLKIRVASVPLRVNVSLGPRIGQEIMCLRGADADGIPCAKNRIRNWLDLEI